MQIHRLVRALRRLRQNQPEHAAHFDGRLLLGLHQSTQSAVSVQHLSVVVVVAHEQPGRVVSLPEQDSIIRFGLCGYLFASIHFCISALKLIKWLQNPPKGQTTTELNAQSSLFTSNPQILLWKFEFTLTSTTPANGIATGESSMIVLVNKLPYGGACTVSPTTGVALNTTFTIDCSSWLDDDGNVAQYAYFGNLSHFFSTTNEKSIYIMEINRKVLVKLMKMICCCL